MNRNSKFSFQWLLKISSYPKSPTITINSIWQHHNASTIPATTPRNRAHQHPTSSTTLTLIPDPRNSPIPWKSISWPGLARPVIRAKLENGARCLSLVEIKGRRRRGSKVKESEYTEGRCNDVHRGGGWRTAKGETACAVKVDYILLSRVATCCTLGPLGLPGKSNHRQPSNEVSLAISGQEEGQMRREACLHCVCPRNICESRGFHFFDFERGDDSFFKSLINENFGFLIIVQWRFRDNEGYIYTYSRIEES